MPKNRPYYGAGDIALAVGKTPQAVRLYLRGRYPRCGRPWWRLDRRQFDDAVGELRARGDGRRRLGRAAMVVSPAVAVERGGEAGGAQRERLAGKEGLHNAALSCAPREML